MQSPSAALAPKRFVAQPPPAGHVFTHEAMGVVTLTLFMLPTIFELSTRSRLHTAGAWPIEPSYKTTAGAGIPLMVSWISITRFAPAAIHDPPNIARPSSPTE